MNLEWIDPPRTKADAEKDRAATVIAELQANPGKWARVATDITDNSAFAEAIYAADLEVREDLVPYGGLTQRLGHNRCRYDLYARAPKEAS